MSSFTAFPQLHKTCWSDSYNNSLFGKSGITKKKVWIKSDKVKQLVLIENYNSYGYIVSWDSLIYNDNGELESTKKRRISYNDLYNHIIEERTDSSEEDGTSKMRIELWFDNRGRLVRKKKDQMRTMQNSVTIYAYNEKDHCILEEQAIDDVIIKTRLEYVYDEDGNIMKEFITPSLGNSTIRTYNYDKASRLFEVYENGQCVERREYNDKSELVKSQTIHYGEGVSHTVNVTRYFFYDSRGRLKASKQTRTLSSGSILKGNKTSYRYDHHGLLKRMDSSAGTLFIEYN